MKKLTVVATALVLAGCAQFAEMTPQQRKITAASIAGAFVIGYYANDDEADIVVIERVYPPTCRPEHSRFCK